jgi:hypothetical protein
VLKVAGALAMTIAVHLNERTPPVTQNTIKQLHQRRASIGRSGAITFATCLTALGLAACGGGGGGGGDGDGRAAGSPAADTAASPASPASPLEAEGAVDVCALIAAADLSAAFGRTFDAGTLTHHDEMGGDQCIWKVADPMSAGLFSLAVQRESALPDQVRDNGIDAERLFDETRRSVGADAVDLALGDRAFSAGSEVSVLYEDAMFDFRTTGNTPEDIAALQSLATSTIEGLTA